MDFIKRCVCGNDFKTHNSCILSCSNECRRERKRRRQKDWRTKNPSYAKSYLAKRIKDGRSAAWQREYRLKNHSKFVVIDKKNTQKYHGLSPSTQKFFLSMKLGEATTNRKPMKQNSAIQTAPTVQQFIASFLDRLKGIEESCKDLAKMVDANPNVFDEIVAADQRFNYNMLESMRKVGKGELYCELLFDPSMAARKLLPLPAPQQKKLYNEPVKVVRVVAGKNVVEEKLLNKMSRAELNQVIDDDKKRARTVEEQIAYVKPPPPTRRAERYEIKDGRIKVMAETEFTLEQWRAILERAEKEALSTLPQSIRANQLR